MKLKSYLPLKDSSFAIIWGAPYWLFFLMFEYVWLQHKSVQISLFVCAFSKQKFSSSSLICLSSTDHNTSGYFRMESRWARFRTELQRNGTSFEEIHGETDDNTIKAFIQKYGVNRRPSWNIYNSFWVQEPSAFFIKGGRNFTVTLCSMSL